MTLKTFNVRPEVYSKFSSFCKEHGISMSKQIELFMQAQMTEEPKAKKEYLKKLDRLRKGNFVAVKDFAKEFGLYE
jgi:hypothetical protein